MFNCNKENKALKSTIKDLEEERKTLKVSVEELKLKKKMETEDIKHMIKINQERKDIELEKAKVVLERNQAAEIAKVKDEYQDKTEKQLTNQVKDMKDMYSEILQRLPNMTVRHNIKETK